MNRREDGFGCPRNKGFSLVELIIVIGIIAVLAAAIAPALIRYITKSRKATDVETADIILHAVNAAYAEDYSYEGEVDNVVQNADRIDTSKKVSVTVGAEAEYDIEMIAVAQDGDTFENNFKPQSHFLSMVRKVLGKESSGNKDFSTPKCRTDSGNGKPDGFLIARRLGEHNSTDRFEIWLVDDNQNPIYRLEPDCCNEYK